MLTVRGAQMSADPVFLASIEISNIAQLLGSSVQITARTSIPGVASTLWLLQLVIIISTSPPARLFSIFIHPT
jgi:hypothetical protein